MSLYLDPDNDQVRDGPLFSIPPHLYEHSESMHAAAIVIGRHGVLLRGPTGSGKSLLQRKLRQAANARGFYSALVSDDYVRLARGPKAPGQGNRDTVPPLLAFAPMATRQMQEVRGFGVTSVDANVSLDLAVMHLLVDLCPPEKIERMPSSDDQTYDCLGYPLAMLSIPQRSANVACDVVFARLSTWKD